MKRLFSIMLTAALLVGCAGMRNLSSEVSSFGTWPAERQPGTYAFDRLPSQQAQAAETDQIEAAARPALEKAGFKAAAPGAAPDVLVQVGVVTTRYDRLVWDDPLWWRGGYGYWRQGPWMGPYWGWGGSAYYGIPHYERAVALLVRDRATGMPLYETRASSDGSLSTSAALISAMFEAALMDFPRQGINPRRVVVALPPQS